LVALGWCEVIVLFRKGARVVGATVLDAKGEMAVLLSSHGVDVGPLTSEETDEGPTGAAEEAAPAGLLWLGTEANEL
jgi:hypothetical protein